MAQASAQPFHRREVGWYCAVTAATLALQRGLVQHLGAELVVLLALAGMAHLVYQRHQQAALASRRAGPLRAEGANTAPTAGSVALFGTVAAILQSAPTWMPEAGALVALVAVAPIFFAYQRDRYIGMLAMLGAAALLSTIALSAAAMFLLTTVPLAAGLAWAFRPETNAREALYGVAGALFCGMEILHQLTATPIFFGWAESQGLLQELLIYACSAFLYTLAWATALSQMASPQEAAKAPNVRRIA